MADMKQIHEFAVKWFSKFRDKKTNYIDLVDHFMADDCEALGFEMDCGHAFVEKYGNAASNCEALEQIIGQVTDGVIPVTRAIPNKRAYDRNRAKQADRNLRAAEG